MAGSPFNRGGVAAASAPVAAPAAKDALPDPVNVGDDQPISKGDPFAGGVADPTGVSGYKPIHFMDQLILMHPTEYGSMVTTTSTAAKPESEFIRADVIPLTVPAAFDQFVNGQGNVDPCEPYEAGQRLEDVMMFNQALVREGQRALQRGTAWILGRVTKGKAQKGRNAPVIIVAASDEDKAIYSSWRQAEAAKR